jgi:hypothetical protein
VPARNQEEKPTASDVVKAPPAAPKRRVKIFTVIGEVTYSEGHDTETRLVLVPQILGDGSQRRQTGSQEGVQAARADLR